MGKKVLQFKQMDNWDRPVYENEGTLYVDVDPLSYMSANLHTKINNDLYGEPDTPINTDNIEYILKPYRITWR